MLFQSHLFCTIVLWVLITPTYSRSPFDAFNSNSNGNKENENKLSKFLNGDLELQDRLLDKKILAGQQQMKISRDQLITSLLNGVGFLGYCFLFKRVGDGIMGMMKMEMDQKKGDNIHPNIKKFLAPNATLSPYESEVLKVKLMISIF
jgi:hypothetical protein